jgi:hypothetical protein
MGAISTSAPALWLKPDAITGLSDGAAVATYVDSSGNSLDATQGTSGLRPTYKTNIKNGLPIVRWAGGQIMGSNASASGAQSAAFVFKSNSYGVRSLIGSSANGGFQFYTQTDATLQVVSQGVSVIGVSQKVAVAPGEWHIAIVTLQPGLAWTIDIDGVLAASGTTGTSLTAGLTTLIGANLGMTQNFDGDTGDIIKWNRALTPSERAGIAAELLTKWAIRYAPLVNLTYSASSTYSADWVPANLGDGAIGYTGVPSRSWSPATGTGFPVQVQAQALSSVVVDQYRIIARSDAPQYTPKDFTFQGSNNGTSWTTLDTRTGQTFTAGESKTYTTSNTTAYTYYRLDITASNTTDATFSEWSLWGPNVAPVTTVVTTDEAIWDADSFTGQIAGSNATPWIDTTNSHTASLTSMSPPLYYPSVVNGHGVARFDQFRGLVTDMMLWSGPVTMTAVIKPAGTDLSTIIGNGGSNGGLQWRYDANKQTLNQQNTLGLYTPNRQDSSMNTTAFHVISIKWTPGCRYRNAVVERTSTFSVSMAAAFATNGDASNYWDVSPVAPNYPTWLRMQPLDVAAHTSYTITPRASALSTAPKDFILQGSMDGNTGWTDLDTRTGITWPTSAAQTFTFSNSTAYPYYRLYISAPVSGGQINLVDVQLGSVPVRVGQIVSYHNGRINGWATRDTDQTVQMNETAWFISVGRDSGEKFNGDIAYLRVVKNEVDDADVLTQHTTLLTKYAISPASGGSEKVLPMARLQAPIASGSWRAMFMTDGVVGTTNNSWSAEAPPPKTISGGTSKPTIMTSYSFQARTDAAASMPSAWTLEGSNNGTSWTVLDTRSGVSWSNSQLQNFVVSGAGAYTQYRWVITAAQGGSSTWPSMTEMYTYGAPPLNTGTGTGFWGILMAAS